MAEYLPAPSFNLGYDVAPMNIGQGYAQGISEAGKAVSGAMAGVSDVMARNQNANDMLTALGPQGAKVLSADQYNSVAGKSLGAKEQLLGMYANQWILDQANQRALSLQRGQGGVDVAVSHAKLLDTINAVQKGYGLAAGLNPQKMPWNPAAQQQQSLQQNQPVVAPPSQAAILAAQQQGGQYAGGPQVRGVPPNVTGAPRLPGTKYIQRTDPATGKTQTGTLYPSGTFIPD